VHSTGPPPPCQAGITPVGTRTYGISRDFPPRDSNWLSDVFSPAVVFLHQTATLPNQTVIVIQNIDAVLTVSNMLHQMKQGLPLGGSP